MRRLLPALLLVACITERPPPSAPTVWYSVAPLPSPPRVGTVDRERMVLAFYDSALFRELSQALSRERARAEAAGDQRQVSVLRLQERNLLDLRERQLRGERGLTNIILALDSRLALVAQARGVDVIVEDGTWTTEAQNIVDVTPQLLELLEGGDEGDGS
jgi:hypothetical protein